MSVINSWKEERGVSVGRKSRRLWSFPGAPRAGLGPTQRILDLLGLGVVS